MLDKRNRLVTGLLTGAMGFCTASAAGAQPPPSPPPEAAREIEGLEDVIVTAQKREVNLQDVPVSVSSYSGAQLEQRGVTDLADLSYIAPNFSLQPGVTSNDSTISSRGIAAASIILGQPESVGIFVDGVFVPGRNVANLDLINIQRVEVLRGPQGTLFGRNTSAGALNITTQPPSAVFRGSVTAEAGDYGLLKTTGTVGGAIVPDLLFAQAGFSASDHDGYVKNLATGNSAQSSADQAFRGSLMLAPSGADWTATLTADFNRDQNLSGDLTPRPFPRVVNQEYDNKDRQNSGGLSFTFNDDFGVARLTSISSVRTYTQRRFQDLDNVVNPPGLASYDRESQTSTQFSQEIRLTSADTGPLLWLVGGYFSHERLALTTGQTLALPEFSAFPPAFPPRYKQTSIQTLFNEINENEAVFGQATWNATDALSLTGGLRWSHDLKDSVTTDIGTIPGLLQSGVNVTSIAEDELTPAASLRYKITPDLQTYISYSQGYKEGTDNVRTLADISPALAPYQLVRPEKSKNYEIGVKSELLDRRLRVNADVFYIDYRNLQVEVEDPASFTRITRNADKAHSLGFEIEINGRLSPVWSVDASVGYAKAKFDRFGACAPSSVGNFAVSCNGNQLANAPDWTGNVSLRFDQPAWDGARAFGGASYAYRGRTYFSSDNALALRRSPYGIVDADVGLRLDSGWSVTMFVRNLLDRNYVNTIQQGSGGIFRATDANNLILSVPGYPRSFGARASYVF